MAIPAITPLQAGTFTERLFSRVLSGLGYRNLAADYDPAALRKMLADFSWERADWLDANYANDICSEQIVDYGFGVDYLIKVAPFNHRLGLDFTINLPAVTRKVSKLKRNKFLWSALHITRMVVVHFELPEGEDQGLIFYDMEDCEDKLLDGIFCAIESKEEVLAVTVKVLRK